MQSAFYTNRIMHTSATTTNLCSSKSSLLSRQTKIRADKWVLRSGDYKKLSGVGSQIKMCLLFDRMCVFARRAFVFCCRPYTKITFCAPSSLLNPLRFFLISIIIRLIHIDTHKQKEPQSFVAWPIVCVVVGVAKDSLL